MSMKQIHSRKIKDRITMLRPKLPIKNMYWEFHKNDDDYWPSVPHGHSLDGNYKLEIWSGNIYKTGTRQPSLTSALRIFLSVLTM